MESSEFNPLVQPLINRIGFSGILITPNKIYYDWFRYLIPEVNYFTEPDTEFLLLPLFRSPEEAEEFCRLFFDLFFQYKLRKCSEDPLFWPVNRTYEMFCQWFDIRITPAVSSLSGTSVNELFASSRLCG